jgi:hypothetical protein
MVKDCEKDELDFNPGSNRKTRKTAEHLVWQCATGWEASPHPGLVRLARRQIITKYEWDLSKEGHFNQIIEITPAKWLVW